MYFPVPHFSDTDINTYYQFYEYFKPAVIELLNEHKYLSIERAAKVHMEQFIVSHCHRKCSLQGMIPNFQLV